MSIFLEYLPGRKSLSVIGYDPDSDFDKPVRVEASSDGISSYVDFTTLEAGQMIDLLRRAIAHAKGQQDLPLDEKAWADMTPGEQAAAQRHDA